MKTLAMRPNGQVRETVRQMPEQAMAQMLVAIFEELARRDNTSVETIVANFLVGYTDG